VDLKSFIRNVPDYPSAGILFRDLTPLMANPDAMRHVTETLSVHLSEKGIQAIAAIDARGFIFGAPVAAQLDVPFVPLRKSGKLPPPVVGVDYALEYGTARLEVAESAFSRHQKVAIIDDLLATGGTAGAGAELILTLGGDVITFAFLVELTFLKGRERLPAEIDVFSIVQY
jgi:adenine phosphoribosyltransferase|tara:strand:- start:367 stop:882 length:516 start_codon:yes stop_codon:yes gene_type:complete